MKELRCRDVGFDCDEVIRGEGEQEVMSKAAKHGREAHDLDELDEKTQERVRALIHDA